MLSDRKDARAEARIRQMLGPAQDDFDVALVTLQMYQPTEYYVKLALQGRATLEEVAQRHQIFTGLEVEHLVYCSMVIQRKAEDRQVFTARRQVGSGMGLPEMEWLLRMEAAMAQPETPPRLIEARPLVSPRTRLQLTHGREGGEWVADGCTLTTVWPFAVEARCPPWTATLLSRCDGHRTTRDHLRFLQESGALPAEASAVEFGKLVRALVQGGFLELADFPLPSSSPS
jgi:hypothetical protein